MTVETVAVAVAFMVISLMQLAADMIMIAVLWRCLNTAGAVSQVADDIGRVEWRLENGKYSSNG